MADSGSASKPLIPALAEMKSWAERYGAGRGRGGTYMS